VDTTLASRVILSVLVDRGLARGDVVSDNDLDSFVRDWLVPVLTPKHLGTRTPGPG
jgi:hypothetical protein